RPTALLFPGSGSQYPKMGFTFYSKFDTFRKTWEEATKVLAGWDEWMKSLGLEHMAKRLENIERTSEDNDEERWECLRDVVENAPQHILMRSSNCQPAILITSIGILRVLEKDYNTDLSASADWFLGHSSGEYSAAVASGAISFEDGVRLTRLHGLLTHETLLNSKLVPFTDFDAPDSLRGQMAAMLIKQGHTHDEVNEVCAFVRSQGELVEVASYNSSAQVVLSGARSGILLAAQELENRGIGARAADLPVSAPFHCSFMEPAQEELKKVLVRMEIKRPRKPIISGLHPAPLFEPSQLIEHLTNQISKPVQWTSALNYLRKEGCERMVYIGPGKALSNMARKEIQRGIWEANKEGEATEIASLATEHDL
ncbi:FabD/lysophospholipase-like protein, partial [Atractiella rhizophila]